MEILNYVQDGEKLHCRAKTGEGDPDDPTEGELACTGERLVFASKRKVIDMDLRSIEEIEYAKKPIHSGYLILTFLMFVASVILLTLLPDLPFIPSDLAALVPIGTGIVGVVSAYEAFIRYRETLYIRLGQSSHTFRGGDLKDFPHAIRGAS